MAGRPIHVFHVVDKRSLSPSMLRIVLVQPTTGSGFDTFVPNDFTDAYVKLVFCDDAVDVSALPQPLLLSSFDVLPTELHPTVRTKTVRRADPETGELTIDVAIHHDRGIAGRWALEAVGGDRVYLMGPGGAYAPNPVADWHLLAGDESALPAIAAALESLPATAVGQAFIEVGTVADELPLNAPVGMSVTWLHRGGPADTVSEDRIGDSAPLVDAIIQADWLPGQPHVFIHGEAQAVMQNLRPYIRHERGVDPAWASISGYWRRGRNEEGFRRWKKMLAVSENPR